MGTLAMLKDYWMCGIGPGDAAFNLVYPKYSYSGIVAPHAHNLFLQIDLSLLIDIIVQCHAHSSPSRTATARMGEPSAS